MENIKYYVINLDKRADRLTDFISNLHDGGFDYSVFNRISAVYDENFGGLGCAKSHLIALTDFLTRSEEKYCAIFEDDFRFRINYSELSDLINKTKKNDPNFKVILLSGTELIPFTTNDSIVQIFECQSASGYIISRDYAGRLINNFIRSILMMEKMRNISQRTLIYNRFAIDQTWKKLQQEGGWYTSIPMPGYQAESYSDIEKRVVDYKVYSS